MGFLENVVQLGWFLNKDDVKRQINLKDSTNDEIVLSNILQVYFDVF